MIQLVVKTENCLFVFASASAGAYEPLLGFGGNFEILDKCFVKVKDIVKILAAILLRLAHLPDLDQAVNDLAKIAGASNAPTIQGRT